MAGRFLRISAPTVGSKLTSHTSPRLGPGLEGLDKVTSLPLFALVCLTRRLIMLRRLGCLLLHLAPSLFNRELQETPSLLEREFLLWFHYSSLRHRIAFSTEG
jgi:hypothetical protein